MSSGNVFERFTKLMWSIGKMLADGVRDLDKVCDLLQTIINGACKPDDDTDSQLKGWQEFYRRFFGIELDLSGLNIPERRKGFGRLIVVVKGLTPNKVFEVCLSHFPCDKYGVDLDNETQGRNDREATQTYAIWVRDHQEADEELKNLSANQLKEQGILGITLLERLLYELKYWSETGKHLDIDKITLCAGSRYSDGDVPDVYWSFGELYVYWYHSGNHCGLLRSRAAVPCEQSA